MAPDLTMSDDPGMYTYGDIMEIYDPYDWVIKLITQAQIGIAILTVSVYGVCKTLDLIDRAYIYIKTHLDDTKVWRRYTLPSIEDLATIQKRAVRWRHERKTLYDHERYIPYLDERSRALKRYRLRTRSISRSFHEAEV